MNVQYLKFKFLAIVFLMAVWTEGSTLHAQNQTFPGNSPIVVPGFGNPRVRPTISVKDPATGKTGRTKEKTPDSSLNRTLEFGEIKVDQDGQLQLSIAKKIYRQVQVERKVPVTSELYDAQGKLVTQKLFHKQLEVKAVQEIEVVNTKLQSGSYQLLQLSFRDKEFQPINKLPSNHEKVILIPRESELSPWFNQLFVPGAVLLKYSPPDSVEE